MWTSTKNKAVVFFCALLQLTPVMCDKVWNEILKYAFIIMEINQRLCEKLGCLGQLWLFVSIFTSDQPRQMTSLAMFCLLCLYHGHSAMSSNREKETTSRRAKTTSICAESAFILFVCLPRGFILHVFFTRSHAAEQVNTNDGSGQQVCGTFQQVFLHLNATPAAAASSVGATCCTNGGQTLLTVVIKFSASLKGTIFLSSFINWEKSYQEQFELVLYLLLKITVTSV